MVIQAQPVHPGVLLGWFWGGLEGAILEGKGEGEEMIISYDIGVNWSWILLALLTCQRVNE